MTDVVEILVKIRAKDYVPSRKNVVELVTYVLKTAFQDADWVDDIQVGLRVP